MNLKEVFGFYRIGWRPCPTSYSRTCYNLGILQDNFSRNWLPRDILVQPRNCSGQIAPKSLLVKLWSPVMSFVQQ